MKKKFTTTLDEELLKNLKVEAAREGVNINTILTILIRMYLQSEKETSFYIFDEKIVKEIKKQKEDKYK